MATKAVVSNIDIDNTRKIVNTGESEEFDNYINSYIKKTSKLSSFIHLHAGYYYYYYYY